ncbi:MAG: GNAT family N-acetyltransferase [Chloroflexi bacterium]|nr:GNAT family N-acetyltransferase [Chloroflexota bacterium]
MAAASSRPPRPKPPADPAKLVRAAAGGYATGDGRFTVEHASGGWMLTDAELTNELGLPLVRGPYPTLDVARAAVDALRSGPAPIYDLAERMAAMPARAARSADRPAPAPRSGRPAPRAAEPLPVVIREFRSRDGESLRTLWAAMGCRSLGDDDMSLRRFAQRNPGLLLVAAQGAAIVGSAMGGWDGRRGWIYHVATAEGHRRSGLATKLVRQVEAGLLAAGCRKVNVIVRDGNEAAAAFWNTLGYGLHEARQYGRELPEGEEGEA